MATTFKSLLNSDTANTRTLLHEAIPITGTIISGTYDDQNIKTFAHGMYEAVFDYPFLSSSANHIIDISAGYSATSEISAAANVQGAKKINIYNQHAQILAGYDSDGGIQDFDTDGNILAGGTKMKEVLFINFGRLLTKDEIKKGSFRFGVYTTASSAPASGQENQFQRTFSSMMELGDYGASTDYKVNSPAGEYGLLFTNSLGATAANRPDNGHSVYGHIYYQAGIAVVTASIFSGAFASGFQGLRATEAAFTGSTIAAISKGVRFLTHNIEFNNTTELNSTIYFCRANTQDYNYSANPTYLESSKVIVKNNNPKAQPVSYITTVGLYSATNELLAVAKLSEPLKKTPSNEITLRVRLDY